MPMATVRAQAGGLVIFAAASLKNALDEIAAAWVKETRQDRTPKSPTRRVRRLAKQMEQGAPADLFLSADLDWMDYVEKKDLIAKDTRVNLLGNKIVLIAPKDSKVFVEMKQGVDLAKALNSDRAGGKLAMANVDAVPAGKYGKAALEKLGAWNGVKDQIAQADNVPRGPLAGGCAARRRSAIVYSTDSAAEPNVKIVGNLPSRFAPADHLSRRRDQGRQVA